MNLRPLLENLIEHAEGFSNAFVQLWQKLKQSQSVIFAMTSLEHIEEELKLCEDKNDTPEQVFQRVSGVLEGWQHARRSDSIAGAEGQMHAAVWQPPPASFLKCNVDAAVFMATKKLHASILARWRWMFSRCNVRRVYRAAMTHSESEAWGFLQSLKWTISLGHHDVIFELDCKMGVDDIHSNKLNRSDQSCKLVKVYSKFIATMKLL